MTEHASTDRIGTERMRAHVRGVFDQAATDAARLAGDAPRTGATSRYDDLRDGDRVRLVYAYDREADGSAWCLGELPATRGRGDAWEGNVVWTVEIGNTRTDWLPAERIQRGPSLDAEFQRG